MKSNKDLIRELIMQNRIYAANGSAASRYKADKYEAELLSRLTRLEELEKENKELKEQKTYLINLCKENKIYPYPPPSTASSQY